MAGMGAGVAVSFLACPTELLKCRLQAQGDAAKAAEAAEVSEYTIVNEMPQAVHSGALFTEFAPRKAPYLHSREAH